MLRGRSRRGRTGSQEDLDAAVGEILGLDGVVEVGTTEVDLG